MLRVIIPIVIALAIIIGCVIYLNTDFTLNKGENDVTYNGVVYERVDLHYNIEHSEENAKKIGSYGQLYAYGQEYIYDLYQLNENILYTPHATFFKSGYPHPSLFGEELANAEYVVSEGINFKGMPDDYTEEATLLATFDKSVKLEDIIESEPSDIIISEEAFKECNEIRFQYKNHDGLYLMLYIYGVDGQYYLDICDYVDDVENHKWHKIKPEYVGLLTSAIRDVE